MAGFSLQRSIGLWRKSLSAVKDAHAPLGHCIIGVIAQRCGSLKKGVSREGGEDWSCSCCGMFGGSRIWLKRCKLTDIHVKIPIERQSIHVGVLVLRFIDEPRVRCVFVSKYCRS